jgi:hypothetical protein
VVCRGVDFFPRRQPREWHKTEGFREEALCLEGEPAPLPRHHGASEPVSAPTARGHTGDDTAG